MSRQTGGMFSEFWSSEPTIRRSIGAKSSVIGIEMTVQTNAPIRPASSPTSAPSLLVIGVGLLLLEQVRGDDAAADDPEAAARIAGGDERQRGQHPHHDAADERRLRSC